MSEVTTITMPDTTEIRSVGEAILHAAKELRIDDQPSYDIAGQFLLMLKKREEEINKTFDPVIKAAYNAHKTALAARDEHLEPVSRAEKIVKDMMKDFQAIEEKRLKDEEKRLREEARKADEAERVERAKELMAAGRPEDVIALLEGEPEPMPVVVPTEMPKSKGIVTRTVWKFKIIDPAKVPCEYHTIDESKIRKLVIATEGKIDIPGIEVYSEKEIAASVKRRGRR